MKKTLLFVVLITAFITTARAAELGNTDTADTTEFNTSSSRWCAFRIGQMPEGGTVTSVKVYMRWYTADMGTKWNYAIGTSTYPTTKRGTDTSITMGNADNVPHWYTMDTGGQYEAAGTYIWVIGYPSDGNYQYKGTLTNGYFNDLVDWVYLTDALPSTFPSGGTVSNYNVNATVVYTPGSPPAGSGPSVPIINVTGRVGAMGKICLRAY